MRKEPLDKNGYQWVLIRDIVVPFDCCLNNILSVQCKFNHTLTNVMYALFPQVSVILHRSKETVRIPNNITVLTVHITKEYI
jgi:hypothetical protein